jgi:hypothetical protein
MLLAGLAACVRRVGCGCGGCRCSSSHWRASRRTCSGRLGGTAGCCQRGRRGSVAVRAIIIGTLDVQRWRMGRGARPGPAPQLVRRSCCCSACSECAMRPSMAISSSCPPLPSAASLSGCKCSPSAATSGAPLRLLGPRGLGPTPPAPPPAPAQKLPGRCAQGVAGLAGWLVAETALDVASSSGIESTTGLASTTESIFRWRSSSSRARRCSSICARSSRAY